MRAAPNVYVPLLEGAAVAVIESLRKEDSINPQGNELVMGVGGAPRWGG